MCICESFSGKACDYYALQGSEYCYFHNPWNLVDGDALAARASKGEVFTADELSDSYHPVRLQNSDDLNMVLDYLVRGNMALENSPERAREMLKLTQTSIKVHKWREKVETDQAWVEFWLGKRSTPI